MVDDMINIALIVALMAILWYFAILYDFYYQEQQALTRVHYREVQILPNKDIVPAVQKL